MTFAVMAPLMFAGLVLFLLLGYPVAFALAANGLLFAVIGIQSGLFDLTLLQALPERVYGILSNQTLLAIPFFTFMGLVLERSGMAEELLDTVGQLFGRVRGGPRLRRRARRRAAGRDHRRDGGDGDRHGPDFAADHAALRLRQAPRQRRDRGLRHAGANYSRPASC